MGGSDQYQYGSLCYIRSRYDDHLISTYKCPYSVDTCESHFIADHGPGASAYCDCVSGYFGV